MDMTNNFAYSCFDGLTEFLAIAYVIETLNMKPASPTLIWISLLLL